MIKGIICDQKKIKGVKYFGLDKKKVCLIRSRNGVLQCLKNEDTCLKRILLAELTKN